MQSPLFSHFKMGEKKSLFHVFSTLILHHGIAKQNKKEEETSTVVFAQFYAPNEKRSKKFALFSISLIDLLYVVHIAHHDTSNSCCIYGVYGMTFLSFLFSLDSYTVDISLVAP